MAKCACGSSAWSDHLTRRQLAILMLVTRGMVSGEIAHGLGVSVRTVEQHLAIMMRRASARNRVELVARCFAAGILVRGVRGWPLEWSGRTCLLFASGQRANIGSVAAVENDAVWTAKAMFAIEAADDNEALAIGNIIIEQMDVVLIKPLTARQSRERIWTVGAELDLSGVPVFEPDNASTRCVYVKRNLGQVTWRVACTDDDHETQEWPPSFWAQRPGADEILAHPAIRGAMIRVEVHSL